MRRSALAQGSHRLLALAIVALALAVPGVSFSQSAQIGADVSASTEAPPQAEATAEATAAPAAPAAAEDTEDQEAKHRRWAMRAANTYFGPVGGVFVVDAGSGAPKSFRLQLMGDLMVKKDYLYNNDKDRYGGGALSLGITPIDHIEFNAAIASRSNYNSKTSPTVLQTSNDLYFGVKAYGDAVPGFTLGGDVQLAILSALGDVGTD